MTFENVNDRNGGTSDRSYWLKRKFTGVIQGELALRPAVTQKGYGLIRHRALIAHQRVITARDNKILLASLVILRWLGVLFGQAGGDHAASCDQHRGCQQAGDNTILLVD